jgi:transmembrane sensor
MKFFITPQLLYKYIDGKCTDEEIFMLHQWYDSFEDQEDPFDALTEQEQEVMKMLMLEKFRASVKTTEAEAIVFEPRKSFPVKLIYTLSGIAALLLIVWGVNLNNKKQSQSAENSIITTASEQMMVENQTSSIYKQTLSDGSVVWLSPKSKLQYPKKFIGAYRQIKMTGEAFFEVTKDHAHPFIIDGGGVITKVWGTSFRIKSSQNIQTEVSVVTGKVSVKIPEKDETEVMLYPQQKATFYYANHALAKGKESEKSAMRMWGKVTESFDDVPLDNVLATLRNHYGMHIYTEDKEFGKYLLKADFTDQSLPAILEMLQNSLNAGYTIDDTQIVLYRKTN